MPYGYPYQPVYGNQMLSGIGPNMATQVQAGNLFARYVAGREEAVAAQVIPDGNLNVFVDMANGRIYTKAVGVNGFSDFREYAFQPPQPKPAEGQGVTMEMFMGLRRDVDALKGLMGTGKEMGDE